MDRVLLESLKGKSREERRAYFEEHKTELLDSTLEKVSGGETGDKENTESNGLDGRGNYWTSWGYVCQGSVRC